MSAYTLPHLFAWAHTPKAPQGSLLSSLFGSEPKIFCLRGSQMLRVENAKGKNLTSVLGAVWITLDGDPQDVVLEPGDSYLVASEEVLIACAIGGDSRLEIQ